MLTDYSDKEFDLMNVSDRMEHNEKIMNFRGFNLRKFEGPKIYDFWPRIELDEVKLCLIDNI